MYDATLAPLIILFTKIFFSSRWQGEKNCRSVYFIWIRIDRI